MAKPKAPLTHRQKMLAAQKKFQEASIAWTEKMLDTYKSMPKEEKEIFDEWERTHVDGSGRFGTDDWPGWEKYIGKKPNPGYEVIETDDDIGRESARQLINDFKKRCKRVNAPQDISVYQGRTETGDHIYYFPPASAFIAYELLRKHKALLCLEEPDLSAFKRIV